MPIHSVSTSIAGFTSGITAVAVSAATAAVSAAPTSPGRSVPQMLLPQLFFPKALESPQFVGQPQLPQPVLLSTVQSSSAEVIKQPGLIQQANSTPVNQQKFQLMQVLPGYDRPRSAAVSDMTTSTKSTATISSVTYKNICPKGSLTCTAGSTSSKVTHSVTQSVQQKMGKVSKSSETVSNLPCKSTVMKCLLQQMPSTKAAVDASKQTLNRSVVCAQTCSGSVVSITQPAASASTNRLSASHVAIVQPQHKDSDGVNNTGIEPERQNPSLQTMQAVQPQTFLQLPQNQQQVLPAVIPNAASLLQVPQNPPAQIQNTQSVPNNQTLLQPNLMQQNMFVLQPAPGNILQNSVLLNGQSGSGVLPVVCPQQIPVQIPNVLNTQAVVLPLTTESGILSDSASTNVTASTSSAVQAAIGVSVTSQAVPSSKVHATQNVPASSIFPVTALQQMVSALNPPPTGPLTQKVIPTPGGGGFNLQPPELCATAAQAAGVQRTQSSFGNKPVSVTTTSTGATNPLQKACILQQSPATNIVFLPPVMAQGHILGGIRLQSPLPVNMVATSMSATNVSLTVPQITEKSPTAMSEAAATVSNSSSSVTVPSSEGQPVTSACETVLLPRTVESETQRTDVSALTFNLIKEHSGCEMGSVDGRKESSGETNTEPSASGLVVSFKVRKYKSGRYMPVRCDYLTDKSLLSIAKLLLSCQVSDQGPVVLQDGRVFIPVKYTGPYTPENHHLKPRPVFGKAPHSGNAVNDFVAKKRGEGSQSNSEFSILTLELQGKTVWMLLDKCGPKIIFDKVEDCSKQIMVLPLEDDLPREAQRQVAGMLKQAKVAFPGSHAPWILSYPYDLGADEKQMGKNWKARRAPSLHRKNLPILPKAEPPKLEPHKAGLLKTESSKAGPTKADQPKAGPSKEDPVSPPKAEPPKAGPSKVGRPRKNLFMVKVEELPKSTKKGDTVQEKARKFVDSVPLSQCATLQPTDQKCPTELSCAPAQGPPPLFKPTPLYSVAGSTTQGKSGQNLQNTTDSHSAEPSQPDRRPPPLWEYKAISAASTSQLDNSKESSMKKVQLTVKASSAVIKRALEAFVKLERLPPTDVLQKQLDAYGSSVVVKCEPYSEHESYGIEKRAEEPYCSADCLKKRGFEVADTVPVTGFHMHMNNEDCDFTPEVDFGSCDSTAISDPKKKRLANVLEGVKVKKEAVDESSFPAFEDGLSRKRKVVKKSSSEGWSELGDDICAHSAAKCHRDNRIQDQKRKNMPRKVHGKKSEDSEEYFDVGSTFSSETGRRRSIRIFCKPKPDYGTLDSLEDCNDDEGSDPEAEIELAPNAKEQLYHSPKSSRMNAGGRRASKGSALNKAASSHVGKVSLGKHSGFDVYLETGESTDEDFEEGVDMDVDEEDMKASLDNEVNNEGIEVCIKTDETSEEENCSGHLSINMDDSSRDNANPNKDEEPVGQVVAGHGKDFKQYIKKVAKRRKTTGKDHEYLCTVCSSYRSHTKEELIRHLRCHHSERLACGACCFRAASCQELIEHEALEHTGKPLYHCPVCQTPFFSHSIFQSHVKRHNTFTCHLCGVLSFSSQEALDKHLEKDHAMTFTCRLCNQRFSEEDQVS